MKTIKRFCAHDTGAAAREPAMKALLREITDKHVGKVGVYNNMIADRAIRNMGKAGVPDRKGQYMLTQKEVEHTLRLDNAAKALREARNRSAVALRHSQTSPICDGCLCKRRISGGACNPNCADLTELEPSLR